MAEYVTREDVKKAFIARYELLEARDIEYVTDSIPAANVRENVPGVWVDDGFLDRLTCSVCGKWISNYTGTVKLNFCPDCGADMRELK